MRFLAPCVCAWLLAAGSAHAGELELAAAKPALRLSARAAESVATRDSFGRPLDMPRRQTPLARALDEAWKKDPSEANLKAWSEVLLKCQQATNPAWTTALARSEPQQAHCYRY